MADSGDSIATTDLQWTKSIDDLLARWCDQSKCFEWMHGEAFSFYDTRARHLMIALNVLTALSGVSNVIAGGAVYGGFQLSWIFGGLSIAVSITNMLQDKLAYASSALEHRQFGQQWGLIRRRIEEEITLPAASRKDCGTFMKQLRADINQVSLAAAGKIPELIRDACYDKFSKIANFDVPDICGQMEHTRVYISDAATPLLPAETADLNRGPR